MNNESSFQNKKESEFNIACNTYSTLPMDQFSSDFKCISSDFKCSQVISSAVLVISSDFYCFYFLCFHEDKGIPKYLGHLNLWKGSKPYLSFLSRINFLLLIFHSFCCFSLNLPTFPYFHPSPSH